MLTTIIFLIGYLFSIIVMSNKDKQFYKNFLYNIGNTGIVLVPYFAVVYFIYKVYLVISPYFKYATCLPDLFENESINSYTTCIDKNKNKN